jgi:hypothetical protein
MRLGNSHWFSGTAWWGLIRKRLVNVFPSYRPELHYMRGPGPKWREKHGRPPTDQLGWHS